ncbi:MAG TPA: fused MFS/spermidine synthase [Burkholderiales bacterium]|nr:fused MFS/spermidine synthase [Burkholderiales bacterium]
MIYAATIFLSSLLLFLVQPLIARLILPWFGGTAAVWTTCMLFFQTLLLAGYAYAHATNARLSARAQAILHTVLLVVALALLPIAPHERWKPLGDEEPVTRILLLLTASVGLPYLLLASTSPLLQAWFARSYPGRNPYRLFAISNLASVLGLLGYPFVVEPFLGNHEQVWGWSALFAAFALACAIASWKAARGTVAASEALEEAGESPPSARDYGLWLSLSAAGSVMLLAVTNHITQNVAAIPLLWVAPLALYLVTFIVAFEGRSLYRAQHWWTIVPVWIGGMCWLLIDKDHQFDLWLQFGIFLSGLFVACMFCHGELYRARPQARHLTAFYLTVSAGGALGGLLVAVAAPLVFNGYFELGVGLVAVALLAALRLGALHLPAMLATSAALLGAAACAVYDAIQYQKDVIVSARNFYGVLRVKEYGTPGTMDHLRRLLHGVILHGEQHLHESRRHDATTYYQPTSGVGVAILSLRERPANRIGIIGLGTGTIASYGREGDTYRFYDINPDVVAFARSQFTFLADSPAKIEISLGDARLNLEREAPQRFDVLAVDAFSSDSIPVHLITKEALGLYLRHMKPDGIVAYHVSNRFLNLVPVVARLAAEHGAHAMLVDEESEEDRTTSTWVLVARDPKALARQEIAEAGASPPETREDWRTWTDDYSNLVQILK